MTTLRALATAAVCLLTCCATLAGPEFQFRFKGTGWQTNGSGQVTSAPMTEQTILKERAAAGGVTDLSTLAIVYHVQGNAIGDTLDIVNPNTGAVLDTVIGFYFGDSFNRASFSNRSGTQERRIDYIYTDQNNHALGSTLTLKIYKKDSQGNLNVTSVSGQMTWLQVLDGTNNVKFITGTFSTGKQLSVTNTP
jgi:hypothetical protein